MVDGLNCLRHNAVIGSNHKHHDVCYLRAPGAHCRKGFVARGIKEYNILPFPIDLVGANVLCYSTGLGFGDLLLPDLVQYGGLPVINVTHDRNHRGPTLGHLRVELLGQSIAQSNPVLVTGVPPDVEAEFRSHPGGSLVVHCLIDIGYDTHQ